MGSAHDTASELTGADFILNNIDDAVIVTDTRGVVTYWNEGATRLFGYSSVEMVGQPYPMRFPTELRPRIEQAIADRLRGINWDGDFEDYRKDGSRVWISARVRKLVDRNGQTVGILGISKDISALKRAEAESHQREAFTRSVLDSMSEHIAVLDRGGHIVAVNKAWRTFSIDNAVTPGRETPRVGSGVNYLEVCRQAAGSCREEALQVAAGIESVLRSETNLYAQEYRCDSPDEERWFALTVTPLHIKEGGVVVSHFNITERRRIEAEVKEQRDRLHVALATAQMGVWIQSLHTQRVMFSPEVYQIFGLLHFDGTLDSIATAVHPEDLPAAQAAYQRLLKAGQPLEIEMRVFRPDGKLRRIAVLGRTHTDDNGVPISLIGTVVDVTLRRRQEQFLKGQTEILGRIAQAVPVEDILGDIVRLVETQIEGGLCSILVKEPDQPLLRFAAGPSLPQAYNQAVAEVPVGPQEGSCGTCAFRGERVWVADIASDPLWAKYRGAALPHGLRSCLSVPILSQHWARGVTSRPPRVLGTFAVYRTDTLGFDEAMNAFIETATYLASVALEKTRARRELQESEQRYRQLLQFLPVGIAVHCEGVITLVNERFRQLAGCADDEPLIGIRLEELFHPDSRPALRARIGALIGGRSNVSTAEVPITRRDGHILQATVVATKVQDNGKTSILVAALDHSQQQRASDLLAAIMSSVSDPIITTDAHGKIVMVNAATEREFGYSQPELVGHSVNRLIPAPQHDAHDQAFARWREAGVPASLQSSRQVTPQRKDGTTFPADTSVTSFLLNGKQHFTAVVHDLSARHKLEEQLRQAQKMEAVGRLAGGIAHDFNNLLTVIVGQTSRLLMQIPADDLLHDPLADVLAAGERAAGLTAQLLAFSRRAIIEPKILDLNQVVTGTTRMLRRLIGEDIQLLTELPPGLGAVKIDAGHLEQVLMNLAVNARDAMPKGGRLHISTSQVIITTPQTDRDTDPAPGEYVQLAVADTGMGMTDEVKARIFEPFFTTKGIGKGTGLGLATVYGIVRQAAGYVSFDSQEGKGTTFRVLLPAVKKPRLATKPQRSLDSPIGTETILLAEDEDVVRKLVRQVLELHGYTVIETSGGQHTLETEAAYDKPIDLLLTDVVMPGLGGPELAQAVRKHRPGIRVIYMSGYTDDAIARRGVEAALDAFIQKPFAPPVLLHKVREQLDRKR